MSSYDHVSLRRGVAHAPADLDEAFAEQFALCLLMPEREVRRMRGETDSIILLALRFGVPVEMMRRRIIDLELLPEPADA